MRFYRPRFNRPILSEWTKAEEQRFKDEQLKKKAAEVYSSYSHVTDEQVAEIVGISEKKLKALML
jgi:cytoplasmic iron level regulating protein YaaA (DUF328/UPF0246 family)|tara:strand:- start:125 stop:319 length:195 start_codon:yes stop_codon:yes gene_type:complete